MTDNLVGVGDMVLLQRYPGDPELLQEFYQVVASQPEDEGHIIVRGWYGDSYYNAWHPSRFRTPDGKPVTGFRQVRAEAKETPGQGFSIYLGERYVMFVMSADDAKYYTDNINRALGVE